MSVNRQDAVKLLADGLALVYHEARNARYLVRDRHLSAVGWERLLSLPTNRVEAWRAIQEIRKKAGDAGTADRATETFEQRFAKDLEDLRDLYANEHWKHAATVGGHARRGVTDTVVSLRDAIVRTSPSEIDSAAQSLLAVRHNNGAVHDKILELDAAIGVETGSCWQQRRLE